MDEADEPRIPVTWSQWGSDYPKRRQRRPRLRHLVVAALVAAIVVVGLGVLP